MRNIILIMLLLSCCGLGYSQSAIGDSISNRIARRMKDSLGLTSNQENKIVEVNKFLANQKQILRTRFTSRDSLQRKFQKIESIRDSLYKKILADKYILYKEKKRRLVNNNRDQN